MDHDRNLDEDGIIKLFRNYIVPKHLFGDIHSFCFKKSFELAEDFEHPNECSPQFYIYLYCFHRVLAKNCPADYKTKK